jgi:hypothetical protein
VSGLSRATSTVKTAAVFGAIGLLVFFINYYVGARLMGDMVNRDFMSLYMGGKSLVLGLDPYDPSVWPDLRVSYGSSWNPELICLYPLWTLILFVPFSLLPFASAVSLWMTVSELGLVASITLLLVATRCQRDRRTVLPAFLGGMVFRPFISSLTSGQIAPVLLLIIAGALALYARGRRFWSGLLWGLLLLKPHLFFLFLAAAGLLFWTRRDWLALWGLAGSTSLLFAVSWLVSPGWLWRWMGVNTKTAVTVGTPTLWGLAFDLVGPDYWRTAGASMLILASLFSLVVVVRHHRDWRFGLGLAIGTSLLVIPYLWNYDHLPLLFPALLAFCRTEGSRLVRILLWSLVAFVIPWALFVVANLRGVDSLSGLVTVAVIVYLCGVRWSNRKRCL